MGWGGVVIYSTGVIDASGHFGLVQCNLRFTNEEEEDLLCDDNEINMVPC